MKRIPRQACTCANCIHGVKVQTPDGTMRRLHVCDFPNCGKTYGKTSHLRAHIRWHSNDKPYACSWVACGKSFTRSDELKRHTRTHTGEKRFACTECGKKFMRSDHRTKHMNSHNRVRAKIESDVKKSLEAMVHKSMMPNHALLQALTGTSATDADKKVLSIRGVHVVEHWTHSVEELVPEM